MRFNARIPLRAGGSASWTRAWPRALAVGLALSANACVANQDVKTASKAVNQTLDTIKATDAVYSKQLADEIELCRQQVGRAIVAESVHAQIDAVANDLENKGDLINLSLQIKQAGAAARTMVGLLLKAKPPENGDSLDPAVWLSSQIQGAEAAASMSGLSAHASEQAKTYLEDLKRTGKVLPSVPAEDVRVLFRLTQMRNDAKAGALTQLDRQVAFIRGLHAEVDQWIQTDVEVKGEDLAKLTEKLTAQLSPPPAPAPPPAAPAPKGATP